MSELDLWIEEVKIWRLQRREKARRARRYPSNWRRLATECKDRAGWRCERCGIKHGQIRWSRHTNRAYPVWLHAHHVRFDPENETPELLALCPSCHFSYRRNPPAWLIEKMKHRKLLERR